MHTPPPPPPPPRTRKASQDILAQAPDVVLLQELEADFLDPTKDANPGASSLQAAYAVHATHDAGPGTAVLLRKERQLGVLEVRRVGATAETGGVSKSATAVRVAVAGASSAAAGRSCWFVSIHLAPPKFNAEAVRRHLGLLHGILQAAGAPAASATAPPRVVVAGDLNADPAELTELQRTSCLGGECALPVAAHSGLARRAHTRFVAWARTHARTHARTQRSCPSFRGLCSAAVARAPRQRFLPPLLGPCCSELRVRRLHVCATVTVVCRLRAPCAGLTRVVHPALGNTGQ